MELLEMSAIGQPENRQSALIGQYALEEVPGLLDMFARLPALYGITILEISGSQRQVKVWLHIDTDLCVEEYLSTQFQKYVG
jgi:hypothetical protein